jgi:type I restriction enzyme M protein
MSNLNEISAKVAKLGNDTWSIADSLWTALPTKGDVKNTILPFMVLRRLDCVLEPSKQKVLKAAKSLNVDATKEMQEKLLAKSTGLKLKVYNRAPFTMAELRNQDPKDLYSNLIDYIHGFPEFLQDVFIKRFELPFKLAKLEEKKKLFSVFDKICQMNLHPENISNLEMGYLYEELIRKFGEKTAEEAGSHYTPREIVTLIAKLLLNNDREAIRGDGVIRTFYDGTCGTGGMLSVAEIEAKKINPSMIVELYGQQLTDDGYAVCVTDMLLKGQDPLRIKLGDTLKRDHHADRKFHFCMANPPYGNEWKDAKEDVEREYQKGFRGRFGAGLPRINDGQLLFVQHFISKLRDDETGGRAGIVLNLSPLFTGGAGSGESNIRKWIIENDLLEGIIGLPKDMFYNTGISTFIWIFNNRKNKKRQGKIRLLDASGTEFWEPMRKSMGDKRKQLSTETVNKIVELFYSNKSSKFIKDFENADFGYTTITVERPLRDKKGKIVLCSIGKRKGQPLYDQNLRDTENIPLKENIEEYFKREVLPYAPDSWVDKSKSKIGYEIPFTRHFYEYKPPRLLEEIDSDLKKITTEIQSLLSKVLK